jgi:PilZ domain-containing protein
MDTSTVSQNRRSRRSHVMLAATLETRGGTISVKLRNLSAEGALVEGDKLPIEGSEVLFRRNELIERGRIVWVDGKHAGLAFNDRLKPEQVLRHIPNPRYRAKPDFRRPGLACRQLTAEEQQLLDSWVKAPSLGRPGD